VSFDPSALVYWRRRIAASQRPDRVFDAVAAVIAGTGILAGRRKRCVDSTVFDDAAATRLVRGSSPVRMSSSRAERANDSGMGLVEAQTLSDHAYASTCGEGPAVAQRADCR